MVFKPFRTPYLITTLREGILNPKKNGERNIKRTSLKNDSKTQKNFFFYKIRDLSFIPKYVLMLQPESFDNIYPSAILD